MAAVVDMGEVEEIHSKEDNIKDGIILNGEISSSKAEENNLSDASDDVMEVDGDQESDQNDMEVNSIEIDDEESNDSSVIENIEENASPNDNQANGIEVHTIDNTDDEDDDEEEEDDDNEIINEELLEEDKDGDVHVISENENEDEEVQESSEVNKGAVKESSSEETNKTSDHAIELNDSGDADIEIIESNTPKENGNAHSPIAGKEESNAIEVEDDVITLDTPVKKYKKHNVLASLDSPRRSARNLSRQTSYKESDKDESNSDEGEESDIEEVLPQDPLAETDSLQHTEKSVGVTKKKSLKPSISSTIVVKDTKRLVEIASKSSPNSSGKKEPTLVIIDTNSILSGRGPIPINQKQPTITQPFPVLPMAVPAQGLYPPNMRATITPIPMHNPSPPHSKSTSLLQSSQSKTLPTILAPSSLSSLSTLPTLLPSATNISQSLPTGSVQPPPILPSLTDDMFVVEAPSFIVPYVYEKPPVKDLKEFLDNFAKEIIAHNLKLDLEEKLKAQKEIESENEKEMEKEKSSRDEEAKKVEEEQKADENDKLEVEVTKTEIQDPRDDDTVKEKEGGEDKTSEKDVEKISDKDDKDEEKTDQNQENVTKEVETAEVEQSKEKETSDKLSEALSKSKVDEQEKSKTAEQEDKTKIIDLDKLEKDKTTSFEEMIRKPYSYFDSPLGKFFMDIGHNLVQEFVQTDLLKQQKRKREREGGKNIETNKTITSLIKNLEYSKENNGPYHMPVRKCDFCSFKTESALAMAFHLETPHMKNFVYRCNFCSYEVRSPHDILFHMEAEHTVRGRLERAPAFHQCPNCPFEDNQKGKLSRHLVACTRKFKPERNLEPPIDWEPPAKIPRVPRMKQSNLSNTAAMYQAMAKNSQYHMIQKMQNAQSALNRGRGRPSLSNIKPPPIMRTPTGMVYKQGMSGGSVLLPTNYQLSGNQLYQQPTSVSKSKPVHQPSISITPLPRNSSAPMPVTKPGDSSAKNSFVICEICDGYIKDLEQLRNHMQWIHKVKIHPKMIYNRPPLNCQKCQFRFFTDQGLERHLLGSHGLVTSSMQEAANKSKDSGRCPVCGRVYQWKLLNHVARDHNMTLKPAHLSYKCTVCTATFGMYKQFENHVYSAHSVVAKRVMDKKSSSPNTSISAAKNDSLLKPLKINDEITIIPQLPKASVVGASISKEGSPTTTLAKNSISVTTTPSTSKSGDLNSSMTRAERLARRKTSSANN